MPARLASFGVELLAGRTEIEPSRSHSPIWREHGMDGWILNYTVAGRGRINRGERRFHVGPGELLLFKPAVAHDYHCDPAVGRWTHLWVYFFPRAPWYEWLAWPEASPGIPRLDLRGAEHHARIVALFDEIVRLHRSTQPRRVQLATSLLEQLLLWADASNPQAAHARLDPRIQRALDLLGQALERPIRLREVARACALSESRLAHLFRAQVGEAPLRWLEGQRISRARELLLTTGQPIAAVGAQAGFANPIWFARVFRRHVGVSPREFRRQGGVPRR